MDRSAEEFIHRQNVINFTRQLAAVDNEAQRRMLMTLLAEERAKALTSDWSPLIS